MCLATVQISLDVRGKRCLEESLDFYCQGELMEGDNQYFCEQAGKKARMLPAVLLLLFALLCSIEEIFFVLPGFLPLPSTWRHCK